MQPYLCIIYDYEDDYYSRDITYMAIINAESAKDAKSKIINYYKSNYTNYPDSVTVKPLSLAIEGSEIIYEIFI